MARPQVNIGDLIRVDYEGQIMLGYVASKLNDGTCHVIERSDGQGWRRNADVPAEYTRRVSDGYWFVDQSDYELMNHPLGHMHDTADYPYEVSVTNGGAYVTYDQLTENNNKPMLQKLSNTLNRVLNKDMQAQYRAGFRNGELELTEDGRRALIEILAVEYETQLADAAREVIEEAENN